MDIFDEELLNLWRGLENENVEYIMVGGFALNLHGFQRTTADMDIWIKDSANNRKNLRNALEKMDLGNIPSIETMQFIPGWSSIKLISGFELDIMTYLKGFEQEKFDACFKIAPVAYIYDIPIRFLHINQLIEAKRATAREKDLIDIIALEKIKKESNS